MAANSAERHMLFGLLALQNGLIEQDQLIAAFRAWSRDKVRPIADLLVERGGLDSDDRAAVEALVTLYQKLEGLLGGQADRESRQALGRAYYELAELTGQLGSMQDSLAMTLRALALFEDLASEAPADAELRPRRRLQRPRRHPRRDWQAFRSAATSRQG